MFASMVRYVKALLLGGLVLPSLVFAVEPIVSSDAGGLGANKADVGFTSTINGDNHMDIIINPGGQGCPAGQFWDIGTGGCTSEVLLRTVNVTQACSCDCGASATGSCSAQQSGSYQVFGWRLPTGGNELISRNGPTSWGGCQTTVNNCVAVPATPPQSADPQPGETVAILSSDLICNASNPNFSQGGGTSVEKNLIIAAYLQHPNGFGRCPESNYAGYAGWTFWQDKLTVDGWSISQVTAAIRTNETSDAAVRQVVNSACTVAANKAYGVTYKSSTYIMGSGNGCSVQF